MNLLRLGVIEVLNVLPVYYSISKNLIKTPCRIVTGKVTELNNKLAKGEIDISVISSFEYARNPELYYVFPNLSVGADGPVKSIYLFLKKPLESLTNETIKLTEFSLTSVHLIQYLLKNHNVSFTQESIDDPTGELLIADDAIRRFYQQEDRFVYDLSELWKKKTGLPFVFALWVCRRDVFNSNPKSVIDTYKALIQSKEMSENQYPQMAKENYRGIFPNPGACEEYLKNIHYELSVNYQTGFKLFQEKLHEMGKLKKVAPLEFIPGI